ncbi:hypothetical protein [Deinococcus arenicola]|uniref:Uncharacterized protein n=1 Tax=Deinococcus arenicola TaxID=2994950 RepID=A0ABU4DW07_9DEIO|nr:hypothetical protein [Deinococcus sp. ZS9-10]MDV6376628.1 hypothetical protein [Deinococcus sp. ZS9-10]
MTSYDVWHVQTYFWDGSGFETHRVHTAAALPWPDVESAGAVVQHWRSMWPDELQNRPPRVGVRPVGAGGECLTVALANGAVHLPRISDLFDDLLDIADMGPHLPAPEL